MIISIPACSISYTNSYMWHSSSPSLTTRLESSFGCPYAQGRPSCRSQCTRPDRLPFIIALGSVNDRGSSLINHNRSLMNAAAVLSSSKYPRPTGLPVALRLRNQKELERRVYYDLQSASLVLRPCQYSTPLLMWSYLHSL
jgi:hypothetical protein